MIGSAPERTFLRTIEGGGTYRFAWVGEGHAGREAVSRDFEVRGPYAPPPPRHGVVAVSSEPHPPADGSSYLRGRVIDEHASTVSRVPLERGRETEIQLVVASPCEGKYEPLPCK